MTRNSRITPTTDTTASTNYKTKSTATKTSETTTPATNPPKNRQLTLQYHPQQRQWQTQLEVRVGWLQPRWQKQWQRKRQHLISVRRLQGHVRQVRKRRQTSPITTIMTKTELMTIKKKWRVHANNNNDNDDNTCNENGHGTYSDREKAMTTTTSQATLYMRIGKNEKRKRSKLYCKSSNAMRKATGQVENWQQKPTGPEAGEPELLAAANDVSRCSKYETMYEALWRNVWPCSSTWFVDPEQKASAHSCKMRKGSSSSLRSPIDVIAKHSWDEWRSDEWWSIRPRTSGSISSASWPSCTSMSTKDWLSQVWTQQRWMCFVER